MITILSVSYHHYLLIISINLTFKNYVYLDLYSDVTDFMRLTLNIKTRKKITILRDLLIEVRIVSQK